MPSLLIDESTNLPIAIRLRDRIATLIIWAGYLWLMRDAFITAWGVLRWIAERLDGFAGAPSPTSLPAPESGVLGTLGIYALLIGFNAVLLLLWARYNHWRFRGHDRRRRTRRVGPAELGQRYRVPAADVAQWQRARRLVMHHDPTGRLLTVETGGEPPKDDLQ